MATTSYPTAAEFQDYCLTYDYGTPGDLEATRIMAAAVKEWDKIVGVRHFLVSEDTTLEIHPQQIQADHRGWIWDLIEPLAELPTSIYSGATATSAGTLFTINRDYRFEGYAPYTQIIFIQKPLDILKVTGKFGYCTEFDADVTDAVLTLGAARLVEQEQGKAGNTLEERTGLVAVKFSQSAVDGLRAYAATIAANYSLP